jgi:hypothetical protein
VKTTQRQHKRDGEVEKEEEGVAGRVGQTIASAIHGANVGLLYSVLALDWLFDLKSDATHKRAAAADGGEAAAASGTLASTLKRGWSETKQKGRRVLDLSWRFGEYDASRAKGRSKSVWLTLQTSPLVDDDGKRTYKGKERYARASIILDRWIFIDLTRYSRF